MKRLNNRGQGMNINAIIKIVLGVALMALLMWGVYIVWTKFSSNISEDNVAEVVQQCNIACSSLSKYNYCEVVREISDGKESKDITCKLLALDKKFGFEGCTQQMRCGYSDVPAGAGIP